MATNFPGKTEFIWFSMRLTHNSHVKKWTLKLLRSERGTQKNFVMKSIKLVEVPKKSQTYEKRWTMKQLHHIWRTNLRHATKKVELPKIISRMKYVFQTEIWYRFQFYSQELNLDFKSEIRNEILNLKLFHIDLHRAPMVKNVVKMGQIDWNKRILGKQVCLMPNYHLIDYWEWWWT